MTNTVAHKLEESVQPQLVVELSTSKAPKIFGESATLSFRTDESNQYIATIHINTSTSLDKVLTVIRSASRKIESQGMRNVHLIGESWTHEHCFAFWQGFWHPKNQISIIYPELVLESKVLLNHWISISKWVREIINLPAEELGPIDLANSALELFTQVAEDKISYEMIVGDDLLEKSYSGLHTVGRGSHRPPVYLKVDYNPTGNPEEPILACLVGKGITFDTGGYSLKASSFMESMKSDMGGAALVSGSLALAMALNVNARIQLILCCADNMVSGNAFRLGDIIHYRNGKTVEVLNTDAEGRLVLADGLIDASSLKPTYIIDCATLTGAAKVALSNDYHALFSFDNNMVHDFCQAASEQHEPFWRLPLDEFHRDQMPSNFADISNTNSAAHTAGASTAAAFLSHFVEPYQNNWLHIDCSATYRKGAVDGWAAGATGIGIRALASYLIVASQQKR
ncbi:aminopeptidase PepB [Thorsellia anophelis]|uniref:PepB aminopeptidase n=1 Tax=Thorsellia anophelis DSM 18579 TaxID=1123402 RepID=A0A1I0A6M3_9GAMM|nr:aminopeptidase PepB [Thorsellia anophelis]SES89775.1 PepB aminopeptidase [Thorsellia anophelis DSM 18579]